uniref:Uncharacterized protein n=1 Tax=Octopus bimaculoides TaxID=37653 RepID=A0A0L8H6R1_OCTBM
MMMMMMAPPLLFFIVLFVLFFLLRQSMLPNLDYLPFVVTQNKPNQTRKRKYTQTTNLFAPSP